MKLEPTVMIRTTIFLFILIKKLKNILKNKKI